MSLDAFRTLPAALSLGTGTTGDSPTGGGVVPEEVQSGVEDTAASTIENLGPVVGPFVNALMGAGVGLAMGVVITIVLTMFFRRRREFFQRLKTLFIPILVSMTLLGARVALGLSEFESTWYRFFLFLMLIAVVSAFAWLALRVVAMIDGQVRSNYVTADTGALRGRRINTQVQLIRRILNAVIIVIAVGAILLAIPQVRALGAGILASAGLISVIAGLAVQSTLTNVFAGLQLAFTDAIRQGDVVQMDDYYGTIEDITLSYVVLKIWDGRRVIFPSSHFTTTPYENYTRVGTAVSGVVEMDVDWRVQLDPLRDRLRELVESTDLWDGKDASMQVTDAVDGMVRIRAVVSARTSGDLWDLRCLVREDLVNFIRADYPDMVYTVREMHMSQGEQVAVAAGATDNTATPDTPSESANRSPQGDQLREDGRDPAVPGDTGGSQTSWTKPIPVDGDPQEWYVPEEPPTEIAVFPAVHTGSSSAQDEDQEQHPRTSSIPLTRSSENSSMFTSSIAGIERGREMAGPGQAAYDERTRRMAENNDAEEDNPDPEDKQ